MIRPLTRTETELWTMWTQASESVMREVERSLFPTMGLTRGDFAVLSRLVDVGNGSLMQRQVAVLLGWERSRLSRQLTRMDADSLVIRHKQGGTNTITATDAGAAAVERARKVFADAVRTALLTAIPHQARDHFWDGIECLVATNTAPEFRRLAWSRSSL